MTRSSWLLIRADADLTDALAALAKSMQALATAIQEHTAAQVAAQTPSRARPSRARTPARAPAKKTAKRTKR